MGDIQMGAHAALALLQILLEDAGCGIFHHSRHKGGAEHRQHTGTGHLCGELRGDRFFNSQFCANFNHTQFLSVPRRRDCGFC